MTRPGQAWGEPLPPDATVVAVAGDDAALAAAAEAHAGAVLAFTPDPSSDFARAVGLRAGREAADADGTVVACDLLDLGNGSPAVNLVVSGRAPDRLRPWHRRRRVTVEVDGRPVADEPAAAVVVANGQFLRGADVVPRGHPGDGRLEVQVYALQAGERAGMRRRLAGGTHVPHPRIRQAVGHRVTIRWPDGGRPLEVDGRARATVSEVGITLRRGALRLLV